MALSWLQQWWHTEPNPQDFREENNLPFAVSTDELCACGFLDECGMHCGDGHNTGQCPPNPVHLDYTEEDFWKEMWS